MSTSPTSVNRNSPEGLYTAVPPCTALAVGTSRVKGNRSGPGSISIRSPPAVRSTSPTSSRLPSVASRKTRKRTVWVAAGAE